MIMFAENLKTIRNNFGQTQKQLSAQLTKGDGTRISKFENGKDVPDLYELCEIASHYRITLDELVYGNLGKLPKKPSFVASLDDLLSLWEAMFPTETSNKAMENHDFRDAYYRHRKVIAALYQGRSIKSEEVDFVVEQYKKIMYTASIKEAAANILSLLSIMCNSITDLPVEDFEKELSGKNGASFSGLQKMTLRNGTSYIKVKQEKKEFTKKHLETICYCIKLLSTDEQLSKLAEYYVVIQYMIGMVYNSYGVDMNFLIGMEQFNWLIARENPYAQKCSVKLENILQFADTAN